MSTLKRPRRWVSLDIEYLTRPRIVELRQAFGAEGPLVLLAVILEADKSDLGRRTDTVEALYGPLGEMAGTSAHAARQILGRAEELKLVTIEQHRDPVTGREFERVKLRERHKWAPRQPEHWQTSDAPKRIPTDERILDVLAEADEPLRATAIADAVGLVAGGSFRTRLARLRGEGRLVSGKDGYRIAGGR